MTNSRIPAAVLFDIDGTLVDSNYLHIDAWQRAFDEVGAAVPAWRIHRAIGMDSAKLLDELAGDLAEDDRERAKELHSEHYKREAHRLRPLPGAPELLRELHERGVRVVLATSAPEDELELLLETLDAGDAVTAATSADDVETAKPEPSIIEVALEKAGVQARDAVMVGDAVWDVEAAKNAGVRVVGVRSGGVAAADLREAGAIEVYDDAAAALASLGRSVLGGQQDVGGAA